MHTPRYDIFIIQLGGFLDVSCMTTYILYQALTAWLAVSKYKKGEFKNEKTDRTGFGTDYGTGIGSLRKQLLRPRGNHCGSPGQHHSYRGQHGGRHCDPESEDCLLRHKPFHRQRQAPFAAGRRI